MIKKYFVTQYCLINMFSTRKLIQPQLFTSQKVQQKFLIKSKTYEFLIHRLPQKHEIYRHQIDTPAGVLKKSGIHIFPPQIPQINKRQKYNAVLKKIQQDYQKSFRNCKQPQQFFHMNRKVNTDIKRKLEFIGIVEDKYKHYMLFEPYMQKLKNKTKQQYLKKGVKVNCLDGLIIYPKGDVWMPTNQKYLADFAYAIKKIQIDKNINDILDLGCGSGILSFLCKKSFKKAKITAVDINSAAVDTTNINAAQHKFGNIRAIQFDLRKKQQFKQKLKQQRLPQLYDLVLLNPPWVHAKKLPNQSDLQGGVYDQNGQMLQSSLKIASEHLRDKNSKILLIYSDLGKILNLNKKSVEQICKQNSLLITNVKQRPLIVNLQKKSPLNQFKQKAVIQTFQIRKA